MGKKYSTYQYVTSSVIRDESELRDFPTLFLTTPQAFPTTTGEDSIRYQTRLGERLEDISLAFYGTPDLWWVIADFQEEPILEPMDVPAGLELRIPSKRIIDRILGGGI